MLDQIRRDIQSRLDELLNEVDKLRRALAALTSRDSSESAKAPAAKPSAAKSTARATARQRASRRARTRSTAAAAPRARAATSTAPARTAPGATKAAVLGALGGGEAMTAGEIAAATGLGRATISTTLSKLAKSGEVTKADRGYLVPKRARRRQPPATRSPRPRPDPQRSRERP